MFGQVSLSYLHDRFYLFSQRIYFCFTLSKKNVLLSTYVFINFFHKNIWNEVLGSLDRCQTLLSHKQRLIGFTRFLFHWYTWVLIRWFSLGLFKLLLKILAWRSFILKFNNFLCLNFFYWLIFNFFHELFKVWGRFCIQWRSVRIYWTSRI